MNLHLNKQFPEEVKKIFEIFLKEKTDSIRLVGGCVRDLITQKEIKDYDFASQFFPNDIIKILEKNNIKAVPTGIEFGTITAVINHKHFEITTLRKDKETDGRHVKPEFVDDYLEDAARRDFTINALYLDVNGKIYDYFNGLSDLADHQVKFIGDADERITEDYLRILRFFRFSARYAKKLDNKGLKACVKNKENIKKLSKERIKDELFKIFDKTSNQKLIWIFDELENSKIREELFSAKFQTEHLKKLLDLKIPTTNHLKFAALIINKEVSLEEIFSNLSFSNKEKKYFTFLFKNFYYLVNLNFKALRELLVFDDKQFVYDLFLLNLSQRKLLKENEIKKLLNYIVEFSLPNFPINGDDLISIGLKGEQIGLKLSELKKKWIESDFKLKREELLKII